MSFAEFVLFWYQLRTYGCPRIRKNCKVQWVAQGSNWHLPKAGKESTAAKQSNLYCSNSISLSLHALALKRKQVRHRHDTPARSKQTKIWQSNGADSAQCGSIETTACQR
jgi:hypothetical protein